MDNQLLRFNIIFILIYLVYLTSTVDSSEQITSLNLDSNANEFDTDRFLLSAGLLIFYFFLYFLNKKLIKICLFLFI